ncbi:hypothetical protein Pan44_23130 [Caulifigura coniformis]|uniref:Uncharacterized protein n=1 Tax=Caulifigura coniformis TaxID=2527983 RepID=A0A517SDT4_9PLAN|nr:hypothetical protein [Caulifigura coniformis]QDT54285.1 hypothetical protein Pan44_23130 [Caulifigura coniformis]
MSPELTNAFNSVSVETKRGACLVAALAFRMRLAMPAAVRRNWSRGKIANAIVDYHPTTDSPAGPVLNGFALSMKKI